MKYKNYVSDLHLNLHPEQMPQLEAWYEHCRRVSDFFTIAYYPYHMVEREGGFCEEAEIDSALMQEQWETISRFLAERSGKDGIVSLLGFEWQGSGEDGDHNVYFKDELVPITLPKRYEGLKAAYRDFDAMAIPHHLAYSLGNRGKNWGTHDESFSPLVEIYSHHGSSERDLTDLPMCRHIHMGPRVDGTSAVAGLKQGKHFGIIAAGDNHEIPAMVKNGRAGVWASEYSKDAIWEALKARRTYGFTGSKMSVWTELDGADMGSMATVALDSATYRVDVVGNSRIERIELYRNGELDQIACHRVTALTGEEDAIRIKFRIECGWGPNVRYFPELTEKVWNGSLTCAGELISVEPVFSSMDNSFEIDDGHKVSFRATSCKKDGSRWMRDAEIRTEGFIFEIEGAPSSIATLSIGGMVRSFTLAELLEGTSIMVFEDEAKRLMKERCGIEVYRRSDNWYHNAYKVRICQASLAEDYEVSVAFDVPVEEREASYFAKAIQADGQRVWSSPTWVTRS